MMIQLFRAAAWISIIAIAVLSLVPPLFRPVSGAPHPAEHFAIFMIAGVAFGLGYRFGHVYQAIGLVFFAGAIELAQYWAPGRHARMSDFVVDSLGACVGILAAWLMVKLMAYRVREPKRQQ